MNDHLVHAENVPGRGEPSPSATRPPWWRLPVTAQVPATDRVEQQPLAPPHDDSVVSTPPGTMAMVRSTPVVTDPNEAGISQVRGVEVREVVPVPRVGAWLGNQVRWYLK